MCGRYALYGPKSRSRYSRPYLDGLDAFEPRYNVAPSQIMPIVRLAEGEPRVAPARWGLVPYWSKDIRIGYKTINARAETLATKPAFRDAYRQRRCLVPASGYYEWQPRPSGKQPYYFTSHDGSLLAFAGLWDVWRPHDGEPVTSYTIIVCESNPLAADVHDRMPVIIDERDWERWLAGPAVGDLLKPSPAASLACHPVSTRVNTPANDDSSLISPAVIPARLGL